MRKPRNSHADVALAHRPPGLTITRWLYDELRGAILAGRFERGAAIAPTRDLASQHGISRRIVVNVFDQLRDEGYLEAHVGRGTVVSASIPEDYLSRTSATSKPSEAPPKPHPVRPFRATIPALTEFPADLWARLSARETRRASVSLLAGNDPAGFWPLREAIRDYLGASRGVTCHAGQIVITSGAQQGVDIIARATIRPGDSVWIEDPGYKDAAEAFRLAGAKVVPVPVDEHGIVPDAGRARCPKPRAIYLTPAHQFPLGVTLRLDRRLDLLQWAQNNRVLIFEDDYDSEFRYFGKPIPAMRGLGAPDRVFLLGTFNKSLFPAVRLGYVVVPEEWVDPVLRLRDAVDRYPPALPQATLAAFLTEGHFTKHLRRMRELYGDRLTALRSNVSRYLGGVLELPQIEAGINIPAFLRNRLTSQQAGDRATRNNIEVWALDRFTFQQPDPSGLVLGFAAFSEREIRKGVVELAQALA
ncbi:MAG: PLP-dependent aminotransferase family protein [Bryobacteraceae bacterium]